MATIAVHVILMPTQGSVRVQTLRLPLFMLPQLVSQLVNARVAINRLQEFLGAEEQEPLPQKPAAQQGAAA